MSIYLVASVILLGVSLLFMAILTVHRSKRLKEEVAKRKQLEEALTFSKKRFRETFQHSAIGMAIVGTDGKWIEVNKTVSELLGYTEAELLKMDFQTITHPEDLEKDLQHVQSLLAGKIRNYTMEKRYVHKEGHIVWAILAVSLVRDNEGNPVHFISQIQDITENKQYHNQIEDKNQQLETLLYVASHDLREPLRTISSFSAIVADRYADQLDGTGKDYLSRVERSVHRMESLLEDILTLSRTRKIGEFVEEIEADKIVKTALDHLEDKIRMTQAKVEVKKDLPILCVDSVWATQAIYNLILNACKFTRNGAPPEITIEGCTDVPGYKGIKVCDRGIGVPDNMQDKVFELFQRAVGREVEGTGAGLAIVQQIAERHGGDVWVDPRDGGGSVFTMIFPVTRIKND